MSQVFRAYIPTVKFGINQMLGTATANVGNAICRVICETSLVHRKVWCYLWSATNGGAINFDLVGEQGGMEVYRQKIAQWTLGAPTTSQFVSGFFPATTLVGSLNENFFVSIGASAVTIICAPWRMNIAADAFYIAVNSISETVATNWDAGIFIQSQKGI